MHCQLLAVHALLARYHSIEHLYLQQWRCCCRAVISCEDDNGNTGIRIGREVMDVAGRALTVNIRDLAHLILPISEKLIYAGNAIARKVAPFVFQRSMLPAT